MKIDEVIFQRRNRLKKHFVNTSNVVLYGYQDVSDAAKITYQVIDGFDWESKETGDSKGYVFPAVETLARIRATSDRTIQRHIRELEQAKLLTRVRRRYRSSILIIEEVSDEEVRKYLGTYVAPKAGGGQGNGGENEGKGNLLGKKVDKQNSRNDKNVFSHSHPETTKMAVVYKKKEKELKENIINVNENLSSKDKREMSPLKDLLIQYELKIPRKAERNGKNNTKLTPVNREKRDYLALKMAEKLSDRKSLGCFRVIAEKVPEPVIFEVLSSIKETAREGKIKVSRGALFVNIIRGYCDSKGIDLGFKNEAGTSPFMEYNG